MNWLNFWIHRPGFLDIDTKTGYIALDSGISTQKRDISPWIPGYRHKSGIYHPKTPALDFGEEPNFNLTTYEERILHMRTSSMQRKTTETNIDLTFAIDGTGKAEIDSGVGFLDHMLILMTRHGLFDLNLSCSGDLAVDQHHTVEDIGIVLGEAFDQALVTKKGINRYATVTTPMDEALSTLSLDISGRPHLVFHVEGLKDKIGTFDTELVNEFFQGFVNHAGITLHINLSYGENSHHMVESIFKGFGRVLDEATLENPRIQGVRSTKGAL